jgi:peptidoglycan/xylan/chitin deacetylase (PgdA/CDA1 family)
VSLVPILLYHSVTSHPHPLIAPFAVDEATFGRHLDLIAERGLTTLTVAGFVDAVERGDEELLRTAAVITFDDGFADFASAALPALQARGMDATLYLATGLLRGGPSPPVDAALADHMLAWSQLPELRAAGTEIGAHSHAHPQMDTLGRARACEEVVVCKRLLEDALAAEVESFAYPHGYSSPRLRRLVRDNGYRSACAVKDALSSPRDDRYALARLMIRATTSVQEVSAWLDRRGAPEHPRSERPRTILWRAYRRGHAVVTRRAGAAPGWPAGRP